MEANKKKTRRRLISTVKTILKEEQEEHSDLYKTPIKVYSSFIDALLEKIEEMDDKILSITYKLNNELKEEQLAIAIDMYDRLSQREKK